MYLNRRGNVLEMRISLSVNHLPVQQRPGYFILHPRIHISSHHPWKHSKGFKCQIGIRIITKLIQSHQQWGTLRGLRESEPYSCANLENLLWPGPIFVGFPCDTLPEFTLFVEFNPSPLRRTSYISYTFSSIKLEPFKRQIGMASPQAVDDKSHHNSKSDGFHNPWTSYQKVPRLISIAFFVRSFLTPKAFKVGPKKYLYVKVIPESDMAWEGIRNPPNDQIQITWYDFPPQTMRHARFVYVSEWFWYFQAWSRIIFSSNGRREYPYRSNVV